MAIEAAFQDLVGKFGALRAAMDGLYVMAIEDQPSRNGVLLVERLSDAVHAMHGWAQEGYAAATQACGAVGHPLDGYRARNALAAANQNFIRLEYRFFSGEMSYRQLVELVKFGQRRDREWQSWIDNVITVLETCRAPLQQLDLAFLSSWQELSEQLGNAGVSIQTTNIGQQVSTSAHGGREHAREAIANDMPP
jgi:hypothetical protein